MQPKLPELTAKTLGNLSENRVGAAINKEIETCVRDCIDRPTDDRPRKITIEITIKPKTDDLKQIYGINAVAKTASKVPPRETSNLDMLINRTEFKAYFNPNSPGDVNQRTIFDDIDADVGEE